jgi:hypothetical protein
MHAVHHAETYDRGIWTGGLPFQVRFDYSYDGVMRRSRTACNASACRASTCW